MNQEELKEQAAERAVEYVRDGMVIGLGSGSTSKLAIDCLGRRVKNENLHVIGVPTSEQTAIQARALGIPLATLDEYPALDLTFDGADEVVLADFSVTKGRGGALLREKIVAAASKMEIIMVDETKIVSALGSKMPIPVEVVPFGWRRTSAVIENLGGKPELRMLPLRDPAQPYVTDGGNYILDCYFAPFTNASELSISLKEVTGVVEHGIFVGLVHRVIIAGTHGIEVVEHPILPN